MMLRALWRACWDDRLARAGLLLLALAAGAALLAPWLAPCEARAMFAPLLAPTAEHPLGTNDLGYDLLAELLAGARTSLALATAAALGSTLLGALLGVVAAYQRRLGWGLLRLVDVFLSVPRLALIVLVAAFVRPGPGTLLGFFVLFGWPRVTRIVYARALSECQSEHIEATQAVGARGWRIVWRHLLPATAPIAFARLIGEMQHVIVAEAGLSFMGLGDPTTQSWGMTLSHAMRYPALLISDVWRWWALPPGLAITLVCLALTLLQLGLDRVADPRLGAVRS